MELRLKGLDGIQTFRDRQFPALCHIEALQAPMAATFTEGLIEFSQTTVSSSTHNRRLGFRSAEHEYGTCSFVSRRRHSFIRVAALLSPFIPHLSQVHSRQIVLKSIINFKFHHLSSRPSGIRFSSRIGPEYFSLKSLKSESGGSLKFYSERVGGTVTGNAG